MHRFRVEAFSQQGARPRAAFGIAVHVPSAEGLEAGLEAGGPHEAAWKAFRSQVTQGLKLQEATHRTTAVLLEVVSSPGTTWQLFNTNGKLLTSLQVLLPGVAVLAMDGEWPLASEPSMGGRPAPRASSRGRKRVLSKMQRRELRGLRSALPRESGRARPRSTRKSRRSARHSPLAEKVPSGQEARGTTPHHQAQHHKGTPHQAAQPGGG